MPSLIDSILRRNGEAWTPEDAQKLAQEAASQRDRLTELLAQSGKSVKKLEKASSQLEPIEAKLRKAQEEQERIEARMKSSQSLVDLLDTVEERSRRIENATVEAADRLDAVSAQAADVEEMRPLLTELLETGRESQARLDELKSSNDDLKRVEDSLRVVQERMDHFEGESRSVSGTYDSLKSLADSLREDLSRMEAAQGAVTIEVTSAKLAAEDLASLTDEFSGVRATAKQVEEELQRLHSLSEHVGRKLAALGNTQEAIERAEVQSRQVNELVFQLEDRVKKVAEESSLLDVVEERTESLRELSSKVESDLRSALTEQEQLQARGDATRKRVESTLDDMQSGLEDASKLKSELELTSARIDDLTQTLTRQSETVAGLNAAEQRAELVEQRTQDLDSRSAVLVERLTEIESGLTALTSTEERLGQVQGQGVRARWADGGHRVS